MGQTRYWLQARAQTSPHALALIYGQERWNYADLNRRSNALAAYLTAQGVQAGDRVAALLPNSPLYVCLIHALAQLGAILVPLNGRLTPSELTWQTEQVGCHWLIAKEELSLANAQSLLVNEQLLEPTPPFSTPHSPPPIPHAPNLQAILFTSGTSGTPKAVPLTFANHFYSTMASAYRIGTLPNDLWLSCLPLYHVGGLAVIFRSCLYGTAVDLHPRFDLDAINRSLDTNPITLISLVPTMLYRLLSSRDHWPASLRLLLLGGAAADPELMARANALPRAVTSDRYSVSSKKLKVGSESPRPLPQPPFPIVAPTYGLTEASSQVATMLPTEATRKPGSVGKPLLFTTVKIVDEQGQDCPPGQVGEIVVSGPTVMAGYLSEVDLTGLVNETNLPSRSRQNLSGLATFVTGDMGYLDEDGDLWLVQRRTDLIVSGGENVYPAEVERVIRKHEAVTAVAVVGIPHPEWGQQVAAAIVLHEESSLTEADLLDYCRAHLAPYKLPRRLLFVADLPQTASGKMARTAVADLFT
jgi:o-succinylbenzoate---CoA ligase